MPVVTVATAAEGTDRTMTDYRNTTNKSARGEDLQTGFIFGGGGVDASAELTNMDTDVPVNNPQGLTMSCRLRHGYEYVSGGDANHCDPDNADAINVGGFVAGAGAAAGAAAGLSAVPVPGARVAALGTLAAGGLGSVAQGYLAEATGGFQFSVKVAAKKKGGDQWYQLGQALPCVPTAGLVGDAKRDVQFAVYSPPEPGEWDVKVIMETMAGDQLSEATRTIYVREDATGQGGSSNGGQGLNQWVLDNPAKAAGIGLFGLVSTRAVIDSTLGE